MHGVLTQNSPRGWGGGYTRHVSGVVISGWWSLGCGWWSLCVAGVLWGGMVWGVSTPPTPKQRIFCVKCFVLVWEVCSGPWVDILKFDIWEFYKSDITFENYTFENMEILKRVIVNLPGFVNIDGDSSIFKGITHEQKHVWREFDETGPGYCFSTVLFGCPYFGKLILKRRYYTKDSYLNCSLTFLHTIPTAFRWCHFEFSSQIFLSFLLIRLWLLL